MTKLYKITVDLDDSPMRQARRRAGATLKGVQDDAQKSAEALERIQDRYYMRDRSRRNRYEAAKEVDAQRQAMRDRAKADRDAAALAAIQDRAFIRDQKRRTSYEAKKDADAQRQAARAQAKADRDAAALEKIQDRYFMRDQKRRAAHQAKVAADAQKEAKRLADIEDRMYMDELRRRTAYQAKKEQEDERAYRRELDRQRRQGERDDRFVAGPLAQSGRLRRRGLTDEEAAAAGRNQAQDRANRRRVKAIADRMDEGGDGWADAIFGATSFGSAVTKAGAAMLAMEAGRKVVMSIAEAFGDAKRAAEEYGKGAIGKLGGLRSLAAVEGERATPQYARRIMDFAVETAMPEGGAQRFLESFLGRAQITKGRQIEEGQFEQYKKMAAQLVTAKGFPEEVGGDLMASVLKTENFKAKGEGAPQAFARAKGMVDILDAGSGKLPILGPQLVQLMSSLTSENNLEGVFRNAGEAAVATSVAAEYNPAEAAVTVQRTIQGLRDFKDKNKAGFYKRAGITPEMGGLDAIQKAIGVIGEDVKKGIPVDKAISNYGFKEIREIRGLETFYNARETVLAPQLARMKKNAGMSPQDIEDYLASAMDIEPIRYARGQAMVERSKFLEGRKEMEPEIAKAAAESRVVARGADTSVPNQINRKVKGFFSLGQVGGREQEIEEQAIRDLGGTPASGTPMDFVTHRRSLFSSYIESALMSLTGANNQMINELQAIRRSNEEMARQGKQAPAPRPGPQGRAAIP